MASILQCNSTYFGNSGGAATETLAFIQNVQAGSLLFVVVGWETGISITSVTTTHDTFTAVAAAQTATATTHQSQAFYCLSAFGGATTIRVAFSGAGGTFVAICMEELAYTVTGLSFTAQQPGTGTPSATSPSITTTAIQSLVIGWVDAGTPFIWAVTGGSGYTLRTNVPPTTVTRDALEDQILGPGTYTAKFSASSGTGAWTCGVAAFAVSVPPLGSPQLQQIGF